MSDQPATRQPNPYRPGFNQAPVVFAGRGDILDAATEAFHVAAFDGRTPRPLILVGPRGVGKTVTLGEIAGIAASEHSWPTVHVEAKSGSLTKELRDRLRAVRPLFEGKTFEGKPERRTKVVGTKLQAQMFGVGAGVELTHKTDATDRTLAQELRDTMAVAIEHSAGLLITLDELQNVSSAELHELGGILQENVPNDWPLVVAIAALPALRAKRGAQVPTYLERAEWHALEDLPDSDAREALTEPAARAERPMTQGAADALLALSGGYPYAIQVAGHFAWRASHGKDTITKAHADAAKPKIVADLEQLFVSRWEGASPREREYLGALASAELAHPLPNGGHVAQQMKERASSVSYLRDRLIKKGTIFRDGAGALRFITPGMGEWIRSRADAN